MLVETLDDTYAIAKLPRPSERTPQSIRAAPVYSLNGGKKRKRREVAVGVDGEAINLYNVQSHANIASYALPPQSQLAAAPCSIFCKHAKTEPAQRRTFAVLRDAGRAKRLRLIGISEAQSRTISSNVLSTPAKQERKLKNSDVVMVDAVNRSNGKDVAVLIQYKNGNVEAVSSDLSSTIWEHNEGGAEPIEVEFATITGLDTARKGVLNSQADAVIAKGTMTTSQMLFQVVQFEGRTHARAFRIAELSSDATYSKPLEKLFDYELPGKARKSSDEVKYELHAASGLLYQHVRGRLTIYNLCSTIPKAETVIGRGHDLRVTSFARLSSSSIFLVYPDKCSVLETRYGASLANRSIPPEAQNDAPLELCSFFSDLGLLIGISGNELVALQLGDNFRGCKSMDHGPLLADVINSKHHTAGALADRVAAKSRRAEKWDQWKSTVDSYVEAGDVHGLEKQLALDLGIFDDADTDGQANGHVGDADDKMALTWDLAAAPYDANNVDGKKALYLLSKTVAWQPSLSNASDENNYELRIIVKSRNIIRWLAVAGYLSIERIESAIPKPLSANDLRISPGAIMQAVYHFDTGFWLTCELLALPIYWDLTEIVQTLKLLIQSLNVTPAEDDMPLTNGHHDENDIIMTNGDVDTQFEAEVAAAARELDYASSVFDYGLRARSEALRLLITRLEGFASDHIVQHLRTTLTIDETIFLIAILRIELRDGGWTSRHVAADPNEMLPIVNEQSLGNAEQLTSSDQALRTIARLLNCCIDAIGVSGWLVGRSGDGMGTEALIETVRAEVSAALEGCYEAEAVSQCLEDAIRLAGSEDVMSRVGVSGALGSDTAAGQQVLMPLGVRHSGSEFTKRTAAKEGRKSRAAIAQEQSRAIGKYTFEQIRF